MTFEDVVRGVVVVSKKGADRYVEDDLATLRIFAGFAAQALVNAENIGRLREQQGELEHRLASQRALLDVNETLLGAGDPTAVLERIADGLRTRRPLRQPDHLPDRPRARRPDGGPGPRPLRRGDPRRGDPDRAAASPAGPPSTASRSWPTTPTSTRARSTSRGRRSSPSRSSSCPLRVGGDVIGTLNVGRMGEARRTSRPTSSSCVKLFAGQASIALQTAEALHAAALRAEHDALTGLRNHGAFQADLEELLAGGPDGERRRRSPCSCSTSTGSRPTTTAAATRPATGSSAAWPTRSPATSGPSTASTGTAATSSRSSCRTCARAEARVIADRLAAAVDDDRLARRTARTSRSASASRPARPTGPRRTSS